MQITEEYLNKFKPKFVPKYRQAQVEAIKFIIDSYLDGYKNCILEAPTGIGKSVIAYVVAEVIRDIQGDRTTITTTSKYLQDQYMEFDALDEIRAKENYDCYYKKGVSYKTPECYQLKKKKKCNPKTTCPYILKRDIWQQSEIRMTNTHYFTKAGDSVCNSDQAGNRTQVTITDEAHNLPNVIVEHSTSVISVKGVNNFIKNQPAFISDFEKDSVIADNMRYIVNRVESAVKPDYSLIIPSDDNFYECISDTRTILDEKAERLEAMMSKIKGISEATDFNKSLNHAKSISSSLLILLKAGNGLYLGENVEDDNDAIRIKPLRASSTADWLYLRKADFNIFMSATIPNVNYYMDEIGINPEDTNIMIMGSPFDVNNRVITYKPLTNFNYSNRMESLDKMVKAIDHLIDHHQNRGLVHTVSYSNAEYIKKNSKHSNKMIIVNGENVKEYLDADKYPDTVMLSPSLYEGVDLKHDLVRFQVLIKVPYGSLGDKFVKLRMQKYPETYIQDTMMKIVQAYGRGMRDYDDYCSTYLLDSNFGRFIEKFPGWVKQAVIR